MKYTVDVNYLLPEESSVIVDVDSIGTITDEFLIEELDLPAGSKIVDFTINAQ